MTRHIGLIALMGCGVSLSTPSQDDGDTNVTAVSLPMPSQGSGNPAGDIFGGCTTCDDLHPQGPFLVGQNFDGLYTPPAASYFFHVTNQGSKGTTHVTLGVTNTAALFTPNHPPLDAWWDGVIVSNGAVSLKLASPRGTTDETHFTLMAQSVPGLYTRSVCDDALPVAGRYGVDGTFYADAAYVTFACSDADAHKCIEWGYGPRQLPDAHQACTRMARDDIVGNGHPHTHLETMIGFHDIYAVNRLPTNIQLQTRPATWPPDPNAVFFEAAFGVDGVVCLARIRWRSLKPNFLPDVPDPRTNNLGIACDDDTVDSLIAKGAILFESSHENDAPLLRWHTPEGDDYVATVRGYYSTSTSGGTAVPPFDGDRVYLFDSVDGYLLRAVPADIDTDTQLTLTTLYRERGTNRMVLAPVNDPRIDPTKYDAFPDPEGWVFNDNLGGMVQLNLYSNPTTGDLLSTTAVNALPSGYRLVGPIGWVLPPDVP